LSGLSLTNIRHTAFDRFREAMGCPCQCGKLPADWHTHGGGWGKGNVRDAYFNLLNVCFFLTPSIWVQFEGPVVDLPGWQEIERAILIGMVCYVFPQVNPV
jgi:hypothetical protein